MNKILKGAKQALAFVRGEAPAAHITTPVGGPYYQGPGRGLIQHHTGDHYIVWNWDTASWDKVREPVRVIGLPQ